MKYLILLIIALFPLAVLLLVNKMAKNSGKEVPETDYQVLLHYPKKIKQSFEVKDITIPNFRVIPPYKTADGKKVRANAIYRSSVLHKPGEKNLKKIKSLGISCICDIRSAFENEKMKNSEIDVISLQNIPVDKESGIVEINGFTTVFNRSEIASHMKKRYIKNVQEAARDYGKALKLLAEEKGPVLYVSRYGKDRMGILIALLLDVLGADRETILDDYSLSNLYSETFYEDFLKKDTVIKRMGIDPREVRVLFGADTDWIKGVFEMIDDKYGNSENFLIQKGKMTKEEITQIRNSYTDEN